MSMKSKVVIERSPGGCYTYIVTIYSGNKKYMTYAGDLGCLFEDYTGERPLIQVLEKIKTKFGINTAEYWDPIAGKVYTIYF